MERGRPSDRECKGYSAPGAATIKLGRSAASSAETSKDACRLSVHQRPTESAAPLEKCYIYSKGAGRKLHLKLPLPSRFTQTSGDPVTFVCEIPVLLQT